MDGHFSRLLASELAAVEQIIPASLHRINQASIIVAKGRSLDIQMNVALPVHAAVLFHLWSGQLAAGRQVCACFFKRPRTHLIRLSFILSLSVRWLCQRQIAPTKRRFWLGFRVLFLIYFIRWWIWWSRVEGKDFLARNIFGLNHIGLFAINLWNVCILGLGAGRNRVFV